MRELVDALAMSSKAMVNTRANSKSDKKLPGGETMGIWNVEVEPEDEDEIRTMRA